MRLFIAVELPPPTMTSAALVGRALQQRVLTLAPAARLTWVAIERLHLTIRFLGEVENPRVAEIEAVLEAPLNIAAFTLTLGAVGAFPPRGAPRVIWLGIDRGLAELTRIEEEVSARLATAGFPPEGRPYSPHLTLARVRDPQGLRVPTLLNGVAPAARSDGLVDAITLFESRLSPRGPTYTLRRRTLLRPA